MTRCLLLWILLIGATLRCSAQQGTNDTIRVGAIVLGDDTLPHIWIREVVVRERAPKWAIKERRRQKREAEAYSRLRYNVYVVYPYAVAAAFILKDVDSVLNSLYSKEAKKQFKRNKENELNRKFKEELKNLSIEQGQVLVKLIARETGRPCYEIVKEMKGGFNAAIWQTVAVLFNNNLRNHYDAEGEDAAMEQIVQEILARGHFEMKK
ncbi:MAG: DUF4294 domain-containing protein [Bacteroidetes bacterium]|nr:DUF4294 domain-containing protein [Bacteroidota bacterium]MBK8143998.1 DUF4294 domain-containing protein [Bacteroidota bacterium]